MYGLMEIIYAYHETNSCFIRNSRWQYFNHIHESLCTYVILLWRISKVERNMNKSRNFRPPKRYTNRPNIIFRQLGYSLYVVSPWFHPKFKALQKTESVRQNCSCVYGCKLIAFEIKMNQSRMVHVWTVQPLNNQLKWCYSNSLFPNVWWIDYFW